MTYLFVLFTLIGCNDDDDIVYEQFNSTEDYVVISVGIEDVLEDVNTILYSSTDEVPVGTGIIRPGGGPFGTEHEIVVEVNDTYEHDVDRVSVRTDSPDRGEDEYDLDPDSADEGVYKITLISVGEPGEVRDDIVHFRLWSIDPTGGETENEE